MVFLGPKKHCFPPKTGFFLAIFVQKLIFFCASGPATPDRLLQYSSKHVSVSRTPSKYCTGRYSSQPRPKEHCYRPNFIYAHELTQHTTQPLKVLFFSPPLDCLAFLHVAGIAKNTSAYTIADAAERVCTTVAANKNTVTAKICSHRRVRVEISTRTRWFFLCWKFVIFHGKFMCGVSPYATQPLFALPLHHWVPLQTLPTVGRLLPLQSVPKTILNFPKPCSQIVL